jgi:acetyltransferase-like isoleucine patch superfamily enzyme
MKSVILMGSIIGYNLFIGLGSVVRGVIPSNSIDSDNPAKVICTL